MAAKKSMTGRIFRRGLRDDAGASAVEFALVAPIFIFLIFAVLEIGFVMYMRSAVETATQNAARMALTGSTYGMQGTREQIITKYLQKQLGPILFASSKMTVDTEVYSGISSLGSKNLKGQNVKAYGARNQIVRYTVNVEYNFITPAIAFVPGAEKGMQIVSTVFVKNEAF